MVLAAEAAIEAAKGDVAATEAKLAQDEITLAIAQEVLAAPRALEGAVAEAKANLGHLAAERDAAKVELEVAQRELDWSTVLAPADGIVLKLLAAPGAHVGPGGDGIVALYDPARLQARIDVPLASVGGVRVGQKVELRSDVMGNATVKGTVLRVQRESDPLKTTLQVKVRVEAPGLLLVPETLVRARFLGKTAGAGASGRAMVFRVPRAAVRGGAVFVVDPAEGRARKVAVETAGEEGGDVLVRGPLSPTQEVILDQVEDGERVQ
jgi:RND family efflux transporter MFP subunit